MTPQCARLRGDLIVSEQETPEGRAFVIKDAARSRFFRLREPEFRLAQQLDGTTPLETARRNVETRFAATISQETVEQFVAKLEQLGLLAVETTGPPGLTRRGTWVRGNILYLRLAAIDPDRLLERLVGRAGFFFTPQFLALSTALVLLAFGVTLSNRYEIGRDFQQLYRVHAVVLAWITVLAVTTIHEFAHGLACKRFGGHVHEIGFLLIYLQPAFYCNVSDAWLFPQKSRRLWVTWAGAYVELVLWALATLLWRVTDPDSLVNYAALVVMATSGMKLAINLNPLIKLDGYYLLSDYLEVPNLRQRAFAYLRSRIGKPSPFREPSRREARIYLGYGLLAGAYSFSLLALVTVALGRFLVSRYQGLGFLIFAALVFTVFIRPLARRGRQSAAGPAHADRLPGPAAHERAIEAGYDSGGGPARPRDSLDPSRREATMETNKIAAPHRQTSPAGPARLEVAPRPVAEPIPADGPPPGWHRGTWRRLLARRRLVWTLAGLLAAPLLVFGRIGLRVSGEFKILPVDHVEVRAEVEGIVEQVAVEEGMAIEAGALIARLSDREYRAELRKVTAEIDEKRAQLKMLRAGPRAEEIAMARTAVEKAVERVRYARRHLEMLDLGRDLVSRKEYDEAREQVAVRDKELEEAREKLGMLLAGNRPEEIEASEAELARLQAEQGHLEEQLELLDIVSPIPGVVTTPKPREQIGHYVGKGDLIADVHALRTVSAEIAVSEKDISDVRVGQPVLLKARAYPWTSFRGVVTSIAPVATKAEDGQPARAVVVVTKLDNPSLLLKPEMTGNAKINAGDRRILDLMTRRFARYLRVEFWSWW